MDFWKYLNEQQEKGDAIKKGGWEGGKNGFGLDNKQRRAGKSRLYRKCSRGEGQNPTRSFRGEGRDLGRRTQMGEKKEFHDPQGIRSVQR